MNQLTLNQLINFANSSTLANLPGGEDRYEIICNLLNMVLIELHARFVIKQDIVDVPLDSNKTSYNLLDYIEKKD